MNSLLLLNTAIIYLPRKPINKNVQITKTYQELDQSFMVLNDKNNTVVEIPNNALKIVAPNYPIKQYLNILTKKGCDSTDDSL